MNKAVASFIFTGETLFNISEKELVEHAVITEMKVEIEEVKEKAKKTIKSETLLVVESLSIDQRVFLEKILASVKVESKDIEIIEQKNFSDYNLSELVFCKRAISFGDFTELKEVFETTEKYQIKVNQQRQVLVVDPLIQVAENKNNEKRLLWEALKQMFL